MLTARPATPLFYFTYSKKMKACARLDEILNAGYLLNGLSILELKFANLAPLWRHLYRRDDLWPPMVF